MTSETNLRPEVQERIREILDEIAWVTCDGDRDGQLIKELQAYAVEVEERFQATFRNQLATGIAVSHKKRRDASAQTPSTRGPGPRPADLFVAVERPISRPNEPPSAAEFLIALFAEKRRREFTLGCAEEEFTRNVAKFGLRRARRLYWSNAVRTCGPAIWAAMKRIGLVAWLLGGL